MLVEAVEAFVLSLQAKFLLHKGRLVLQVDHGLVAIGLQPARHLVSWLNAAKAHSVILLAPRYHLTHVELR